MFSTHFDDVPEIGLEELVESVKATLRPDDFESMEACAGYLAGFARNKTILADLVNESIRSLLSSRTVAPVRTPQSFLIGVEESFYVRCNLWMPLDPALQSKAFQERLYSLEVPHDHNFSFLTVGYLGPGYSTDVFEYDRSGVDGRIGESVDLRPSGSYTLGVGDVMLYRQGIDVHVQHQPPAPSASINIMFLSEYAAREWQYLFDLEERRISGLSGSSMRSQHELLALAGEVGDSETAGLLEEISRKSPSSQTRRAGVAALEALTTAMAGG
jgi:hypothetical protein